MARVTVEDCVQKLNNRYELVLLASYRSRELSYGVEPLVERDNDKPTVIALREIAENKLENDDLRAKYANFVKQGSIFGGALQEEDEDDLEAKEIALDLSKEELDDEDREALELDDEALDEEALSEEDEK